MKKIKTIDVISGKVKVEENKDNKFEELAILTSGKRILLIKKTTK
ncbi:hypothetical protein [Aliarcobacter butzleri]